jgi:hypothetical protein
MGWINGSFMENDTWLIVDVLGNARALELIGTWRTTQENMRNHSVTWL